MAVGDPIIQFAGGAADLVYRPAAGVTIMVTAAGSQTNSGIDSKFILREVATGLYSFFYGHSSSAGNNGNTPRDFNNMKILFNNDYEVYMSSTQSKCFTAFQIQ